MDHEGGRGATARPPLSTPRPLVPCSRPRARGSKHEGDGIRCSWFRACFVQFSGITLGLRDRDPVLLSLSVIWNRLLVVALLGAAILLFRAGHNCCPEIQDARGDVEASQLDDGTPVITPS